MKRIRDNRLYVDLEDMFYLGLADKVKNYKMDKGLLEINDSLTINYILFRDDIYDYDYIDSLSDEEIRSMLIKLEEDIFFYDHQYLNIFPTNMLVEKDKKRKKMLNECNYRSHTLSTYFNKHRKDSIYKLGGLK